MICKFPSCTLETVTDAVHDLGLELADVTSMEEAFSLYVRRVCEFTGMECGGIYLLNRDKNDLELKYQKGLSHDFLQYSESGEYNSSAWKLVMTGKPIYCKYCELPIKKWTQEGLETLAIIPIKYLGQVIACQNFASHTEKEMAPATRIGMESAGALLGNTIVRFNLELQLQEYRDKLQQLALELSRTEKREREHLAQVLHDDLQQLLLAIKLETEVTAKAVEGKPRRQLDHATILLQEAIDLSRNLAVELCPPILQHADLIPALKWLKKDMQKMYHLKVQVQVEEENEKIELRQDLRIFLFHAIRELLINTVKHAGIRKSSIRLFKNAKHFTVAVEDCGCGFDLNTIKNAAENGDSFGISSIHERLSAFGGTLEINTSPGKGSSFRITLPLQNLVPVRC